MGLVFDRRGGVCGCRPVLFHSEHVSPVACLSCVGLRRNPTTPLRQSRSVNRTTSQLRRSRCQLQRLNEIWFRDQVLDGRLQPIFRFPWANYGRLLLDEGFAGRSKSVSPLKLDQATTYFSVEVRFRNALCLIRFNKSKVERVRQNERRWEWRARGCAFRESGVGEKTLRDWRMRVNGTGSQSMRETASGMVGVRITGE